MEPTLHPDCQRLAFLLGTWPGEGEGEWPRGEPFCYGEEMTFEHDGDAFLIYAQKSWMLEDGAPLHAEGTVGGGAIDVASTDVVTTTTGSPVTVLERHLEVRDTGSATSCGWRCCQRRCRVPACHQWKCGP